MVVFNDGAERTFARAKELARESFPSGLVQTGHILGALVLSDCETGRFLREKGLTFSAIEGKHHGLVFSFPVVKEDDFPWTSLGQKVTSLALALGNRTSDNTHLLLALLAIVCFRQHKMARFFREIGLDPHDLLREACDLFWGLPQESIIAKLSQEETATL